MKQTFKIILSLCLLLGIITNAQCQSDSLKVKRDIAAIRINLTQLLNIGFEFFPEKHHALALEGQIWSPKHLARGTEGRGINRVYLDYRYYFSKKTGTSGLFLGAYMMYMKKHVVRMFTHPDYHGIRYEALAEGMWGGALVGYRKRFDAKVFLSVYLGVAGALFKEDEIYDYSPPILRPTGYTNTVYPPSYFNKDIRTGIEIGFLF